MSLRSEAREEEHDRATRRIDPGAISPDSYNPDITNGGKGAQ